MLRFIMGSKNSKRPTAPLTRVKKWKRNATEKYIKYLSALVHAPHKLRQVNDSGKMYYKVCYITSTENLPKYKAYIYALNTTLKDEYEKKLRMAVPLLPQQHLRLAPFGDELYVLWDNP